MTDDTKPKKQPVDDELTVVREVRLYHDNRPIILRPGDRINRADFSSDVVAAAEALRAFTR